MEDMSEHFEARGLLAIPQWQAHLIVFVALLAPLLAILALLHCIEWL